MTTEHPISRQVEEDNRLRLRLVRAFDIQTDQPPERVDTYVINPHCPYSLAGHAIEVGEDGPRCYFCGPLAWTVLT